MAFPWLLLQYAECFAGGFLISYCLCYRSKSRREETEKEGVFVDADVEKSVIEDECSTLIVADTEAIEGKGVFTKDNPGYLNEKEDEKKAKCNPPEDVNFVSQLCINEEGNRDNAELAMNSRRNGQNFVKKNFDPFRLMLSYQNQNETRACRKDFIKNHSVARRSTLDQNFCYLK